MAVFEVNPSTIIEDMGLLIKYVGEIEDELNSVTTTVNGLVGTAWTSEVAIKYQTKIKNEIDKANSFLEQLAGGNGYLEQVRQLAYDTIENDNAIANQFDSML